MIDVDLPRLGLREAELLARVSELEADLARAVAERQQAEVELEALRGGGRSS